MCSDAAAWRSEHCTSRPTAAVTPDESAHWQRGDWVRINGRHLGQILKVEGTGRALRLLVESTTDLGRRTIDPRRDRVERMR